MQRPLLPDLTAGASPLPDANDAVTLVGAQRARPWRLRYHGDNFGWSQREDPSVFNAGDRLVVSLLRRLMTANTTTPILWWLSLITHRRVSRRAGRVVRGWSAGVVYSRAPELRGKYLFSGFVPGRVFYANTREAFGP